MAAELRSTLARVVEASGDEASSSTSVSHPHSVSVRVTSQTYLIVVSCALQVAGAAGGGLLPLHSNTLCGSTFFLPNFEGKDPAFVEFITGRLVYKYGPSSARTRTMGSRPAGSRPAG